MKNKTMIRLKQRFPMISMIRRSLVSLLIIGQVIMIPQAQGAARIKDIVSFEGIRDNMLIGYGLVVGLNGTGDNLKNAAFTEKGLTDFLGRLGINATGANLKTKNIAAVTVTATLPPFSRQGGHIDVTVSTLGDAKSLEGGTLLAAPLLGADGEVYAVAQGAIAIGGFQAAGNSATVSKGVPTSGIIANGAIIEREVPFDLNTLATLNLGLRNPDISTAERIASAINRKLAIETAMAKDPGTVSLKVPEKYQGNVVGLLSSIEQIRVMPDQHAKIVIDEASGTIVMGQHVKVDKVAIAQGNLTVRVEEQEDIYANPFETAVSTATNVGIEGDPGVGFAIVEQAGAELGELVKGLNALGVGPRDMITILQTIKAAGALQAEIIAR